MKKRIMCYGDSNTWGYIAGKVFTRFPEGVRWTSVLQEQLGDSYTVIEEGYNGRTTVWFDPIERRMSGYDYLIPCLDSNSPVDLVIVMLGTNDTKTYFSNSAVNIASSVSRIAERILSSPYGESFGTPPKVMIVSPPLIKNPVFNGMLDCTSEEKSKHFAEEYRKIAETLGCSFFDAACCTETDIDGVHITEESHRVLGTRLAAAVKESLNEA